MDLQDGHGSGSVDEKTGKRYQYSAVPETKQTNTGYYTEALSQNNELAKTALLKDSLSTK